MKTTVLALLLSGGYGFIATSHAEVNLPAGPAETQNEDSAMDQTAEYTAHYVLSRRGTERGEASRLLERLNDDQWRYYTATSARLLIFTDRRKNETFFRMEEGRVKPLLFDYNREGTGSDQSLRVRFDYANEALVSEGDTEIEAAWSAGLLDPNAVLHQLQLDVAGEGDNWTYPLVNERGDYRDYEFARDGTETLTLPYGTFDTVRVVRVRDNNRRETIFWFAPELNYTLVKMQQIKEGREQLQIQLKDLDM